MSKSAKIVFLIDVNHSQPTFDTCKDIEKRNGRILLSCLKLMNYVTHQRLKNYTKVQWGYKFYSSNTNEKHFRSHRQSFIDYELQHLEEFQENLIECVKKNGEMNEKDKLSHAQRLNIVLREILYDFDWDSPDISTPDKIRKSTKTILTKRRKNDENEFDKFVFIVTKCPYTRDELYNFIGKEEMNCNRILMPILMSNAVFNSYVSKYSIKLIWLDVDDDHLLTQNDICDGYEVMRKVMKNVNGNLIGISNLLDTSKPFESIIEWNLKSEIDKFQFDSLLQFGNEAFEIELFTFDDNRKLFEFFQLIKCDREFYPIFVTGLTLKRFLSVQYSFGCLARDGWKEKYYNLLKILIDNDMNLFVNINGCCGILYPVSPVLAVLCLMDLKPNSLSLDSEIVVKRFDYPKSSEDLRKLDEKNSNALKFITETIEKNRNIKSSHKKYEKNESTKKFCFNSLTKWFIGDSVSFKSDFEMKPAQQSLKNRENELFERLSRHLKEKETTTDPQIETNDETESPIVIPKVSSNLKVSERSSELVIQSLKNLKAKKNELKNADTKKKTKKRIEKPSRTREMSETMDKFTWSDEEKLIGQLKDYYKQCIDNNQSLLTCAENIINVVIHHVQMNDRNNDDNIATRLLNNELFKTPAMIAKTYENSNSTDRIREYEIQALLRMETINSKLNTENEQILDEVIMLLRMLSLYSNASHLSVFLKEILLPNYSDNSLDAVITIFEELNQSLPPEFDSESSSDDEMQLQNWDLSNNVEIDSKTTDSDYHSYNSSSSSAKSSVMSIKTRKFSMPICRNKLGEKRTITITAKQKAKLKINTSSSTSEIQKEFDKKKKKTARRSLFSPKSNKKSILTTPTKKLDDIVFETPIEEIEKKFARRRRNLVVRETPLHKIARRLYTSDSQPVTEEEIVDNSPKRSIARVRRFLSSPGKFRPSESSENYDFVVSSPVSKGQTSPEPLRLPTWNVMNLSCSANSPEIDFFDQNAIFDPDEMELSKDDDVFYQEKSEIECNKSPFDTWKRVKRRSDTLSSTNKRKSENGSECRAKKRAKSEILINQTPTKNVIEKPNFTSPTSLSLLHIITSPVKNSKIYKRF